MAGLNKSPLLAGGVECQPLEWGADELTDREAQSEVEMVSMYVCMYNGNTVICLAVLLTSKLPACLLLVACCCCRLDWPDLTWQGTDEEQSQLRVILLLNAVYCAATTCLPSLLNVQPDSLALLAVDLELARDSRNEWPWRPVERERESSELQ